MGNDALDHLETSQTTASSTGRCRHSPSRWRSHWRNSGHDGEHLDFQEGCYSTCRHGVKSTRVVRGKMGWGTQRTNEKVQRNICRGIRSSERLSGPSATKFRPEENRQTLTETTHKVATKAVHEPVLMEYITSRLISRRVLECYRYEELYMEGRKE